MSRSDLPEEYQHFRFYYYEPSMPAAIIFAVLFALATLLHTYQLVRSRTWFMIPFVVGGICELKYSKSALQLCVLTNTGISASRDRWLYWSYYLSDREPWTIRQDPVYHPKPTFAHRAASLRSIGIHGARTHRSHGRRRK